MGNISLTQNRYFGSVLKSPTQMGSLSVKNSVTNTVSQAEAPLKWEIWNTRNITYLKYFSSNLFGYFWRSEIRKEINLINPWWEAESGQWFWKRRDYVQWGGKYFPFTPGHKRVGHPLTPSHPPPSTPLPPFNPPPHNLEELACSYKGNSPFEKRFFSYPSEFYSI